PLVDLGLCRPYLALARLQLRREPPRVLEPDIGPPQRVLPLPQDDLRFGDAQLPLPQPHVRLGVQPRPFVELGVQLVEAGGPRVQLGRPPVDRLRQPTLALGERAPGRSDLALSGHEDKFRLSAGLPASRCLLATNRKYPI